MGNIYNINITLKAMWQQPFVAVVLVYYWRLVPVGSEGMVWYMLFGRYFGCNQTRSHCKFGTLWVISIFLMKALAVAPAHVHSYAMVFGTDHVSLWGSIIHLMGLSTENA